MKGRHLGLSAAGIKSYDQLTDALDALNQAGRQTPCAGRAADFTALDCRHCPVQRLCHDHGNKFEQATEWKQGRKNQDGQTKARHRTTETPPPRSTTTTRERPQQTMIELTKDGETIRADPDHFANLTSQGWQTTTPQQPEGITTNV